LIVDHVSGNKRLAPIFHVLPLLDFSKTGDNLGGHRGTAVFATRVEPGKIRCWKGKSMTLAEFHDSVGSLPNVAGNGAGFDGFA
jgi:hypothetical protein